MIEGNDFKLEYLPEHSKFDLYLLKTINAKNAKMLIKKEKNLY